MLADDSQMDSDIIGEMITQQLKALVSAAARQGKLGSVKKTVCFQNKMCFRGLSWDTFIHINFSAA